ncbi:hypothetical protein Bpla01_49170 [Burkholderia plantarii]|nr:hypothetical protein Bpla01_49170 [Burkholderia plantarii]
MPRAAVNRGTKVPQFTSSGYYPTGTQRPGRAARRDSGAMRAVPEPDMKLIRSKTFTASRAWGALDIANMRGITTRLHWTDQPYVWHVNDGEEVFVVLDGQVDMHYRDAAGEHVAVLEAGDIFHATVGTEHVAHPRGEARILVVETEGSV